MPQSSEITSIKRAQGLFFICASLLFIGFISSTPAHAAPGNTPYTLNFSGYLANSNGSAASGSYPMRFSLWLGVSPARVWCAEYSSVSVVNGDFAVPLGSTLQGGEGLDTSCSTSVPANLPLTPALVSGVDSSTPVQLEVDVSADGGSSWETLTPNLTVSSAMFALQADNALSAENTSAIQGVSVSATSPTLNQILQFNGTDWTPATVASGGGTPAGSQGYIQYNSSGSFGATQNLFWDSTNNRLGVGTSTPLTQIDVSGTNTNGSFRVFDQSGSGNTREIIKSGASQSANLTEWQNNAGAVQASMSAAGALSASSVKLPSGTGSIVLQGASGGATAVTWNLPDSVGSSNQVLSTDGAGNLSWATPAAGGSGTVTNVTGTAPISVATGTTTPVISISQATTSTNGYLSQADWNTFNSKLSSTLSSGDLFVGNGSNTATAVALSGDATLANTGALTVTGIEGKAISGTATTGQSLEYNGTNWVPFTPVSTVNNSAWSGTQLSVANGGTGDTTLTAHGVLIGEGSSAVAETSAGTTGYPLVSSGASADPTFQQLSLTAGVSGTLPVANGGSGQTALTSGSLVVGNGTSAVNLIAPSTNGNILGVNGSGAWVSETPATAGLASSSALSSYVPLAGGTMTGDLSCALDGASANNGAVSIGGAPFNGSTSGYFGTGSSSNASGTELAINAASSYAGDLANFQVAGAAQFVVKPTGDVHIAGKYYGDGSQLTNVGGVWTTSGSNIANNNAGYVGVGTGATAPAEPLQVKGEIGVGNTGLACSSTTQGAIRYNTSTNALEYCNGTSWSLVQAAACTNPSPTAFSFTNLANETISTQYQSNIVQITGINCLVTTTISGGGSPEYRICADSGCGTVLQGWTSGPSSISSGQYMQVEETTSASGGVSTQAAIIVGGTASIWTVATSGSCAGLPSSPPAVGTVCADGTVYAGLSPDAGYVPMFTTRCDLGQSWNAGSGTCTGTADLLFWNNGTSNWTTTGFTSSITGQSNTAGLVALSDAGAPYYAADDCNSLSTAGITEGSGAWYLPAENELYVLYQGSGTIGNFNTSGQAYWSSTESSLWQPVAQVTRFSDGFQYGPNKNNNFLVRCVRR